LGGGGFDLARIDKESGEVTGPIRMHDRSPTYVLDRVGGVVIVAKDNQLVGYRYLVFLFLS
jgi:hypothetical protein